MEKSQNIKVNIIVPIFNVENYLKYCLDSIKNQTYSDFECILINDGSTDKSEEIAREFLKNDKRFLLLNKPNAGQSSARNAGLEISLGTALRDILENNYKEEFIASNKEINTFNKEIKNIAKSEILNHFTKDEQERVYNCDLGDLNTILVQDLSENLLIRFVDSDDILPQDSIEDCINKLSNNNIDIVMQKTKQVFENQEEKILDDLSSTHNDIFTIENIIQKKQYDLFFAWAGAFYARLLNIYNLRFLVGIFHEDNLFGTILFCLSKANIKSDFIGYIYKMRSNSIMNKIGGEWPEKYLQNLELLHKDYKNFKDAREYFKIFCLIRIAYCIWEFNKNINSSKIKSYLNRVILQYLKSYLYFKYNKKYSQLKYDTLKIENIVENMGYKNKIIIWHLFRHPTQIFSFLFKKELR